MDVPSRVKSLISSQMLTQRKFADSIGISPARLNNYLAGLSKVPQDILIKIAEIYNCSLTWLLTGEGDMYQQCFTTLPYKLPRLFTTLLPKHPCQAVHFTENQK